MNELRVDPLTGLKSIIAAARATRPGGGLRVEPPDPIDPAGDPFAPGHEDQTPPELYALRPDGRPENGPGWSVRVVPNLYPALTPDAVEPERHANPDLFTAQAALGHHEVIINAPDAVTSLTDLEPAQVAQAMEVWRERLNVHRDAACRHLIVNERREAGASLPHTHAQLYALRVRARRDRPRARAGDRVRHPDDGRRPAGRPRAGGGPPARPRGRDRRRGGRARAVRLARPVPAPDRPAALAPALRGRGPLGAALLHDVLSRLRRRLGASPPLNLWVRTAPRGADHFCWRIDVLPRLTHMAGLEHGAGVNLCIVAPEQAAAELRGA